MQTDTKTKYINSKEANQKESISLDGIDKVKDILFGHELRELQKKIDRIAQIQMDHGVSITELKSTTSEQEKSKVSLKQLSDLFLDLSRKIVN